MIDKLKEVMKKADALKLEDIKLIKTALFVAVAVDLFGIYWYFRLKSLGIALLLVIMGVLAVILYLERQKEPPEEDRPSEAPKDANKPIDMLGDINSPADDIGMQIWDADDYNNRLKKALTGR